MALILPHHERELRILAEQYSIDYEQLLRYVRERARDYTIIYTGEVRDIATHYCTGKGTSTASYIAQRNLSRRYDHSRYSRWDREQERGE